MSVSQEPGVAEELTVAEVMGEARRRIAAARDAVQGRAGESSARLAAELDEFLDDLAPGKGLDLEDRDLVIPHALAALMGIAVREL